MELSSLTLQNTVIALLHNITALVLSGGFGFDDWIDFIVSKCWNQHRSTRGPLTLNMVNNNDCVTDVLPAVTVEDILLLNHNNKVHQTK